MTKLKLFIIGLTVVILLSACGEMDGEELLLDTGEATLTSSPEASFTTDKEKANEVIMTYYDYAMKVHKPIFNKTYTDKQEYVDLTTAYLNYINSINPKELGFTNDLLESYLWDFDYHTTKYAEAALDYLNTGESVHKSLAKDYYNDALTDMDLISSVIE